MSYEEEDACRSYEEEDTYLVPHAARVDYYSVKRDLLQCQKRPTTVSKDTYLVPHAASVDTVVGLF